ncbi:MAG: division/cell wall cluster transcriptional repressor MraZ [Oscillospiraceae bacterium]|nr:division/cell wall cluster transcriptional repressor MraZ [Oscillospiraceae bacterium]
MVEKEVSHSLVGEYSHSVDPKGRVLLPSKYRDIFGDVVYLARTIDDCITAYTAKAWAELTEKLNSQPSTKLRDYRRRFFSSACDVQVDSAGRILLPPKLREIAGIDKSAKIIGAGEYAEIWNEEVYEKRMAALDESGDFEDMLNEMGL